MGRKTGKEMKNLMVAISLSTLILVLAIVTYFVIDVAVTTNSNMKDNKAKMIDQSVLLLKQISNNLLDINKNMTLMKYFNRDLWDQIAAGDFSGFFEMAAQMGITLYPVEYVSIVEDGQIMKYATHGVNNIDPASLPSAPSGGDYETLNSLGDKQGFFISVCTQPI